LDFRTKGVYVDNLEIMFSNCSKLSIYSLIVFALLWVRGIREFQFSLKRESKGVVICFDNSVDISTQGNKVVQVSK
jgi:hypothetical protein